MHINIPIREPFYPTEEESFSPSANIRVIERAKTENSIISEEWKNILIEWEGSKKILIAVGQSEYNENLYQLLLNLSEKFSIPIIGDVISNIQSDELFISKQDLILSENNVKHLAPDLLITMGKSFISKNLKKFIKNNPPQKHWCVSEDSHLIDTFQSLTRQLNVAPEYFFEKLIKELNDSQEGKFEMYKTYKGSWLQEEQAKSTLSENFIKILTSLNDITAINFVLRNLPVGSQLHLANSMTVRYANMLGIEQEGIEVFCNRGTSGIDGCVSTAIGAALSTMRPVYLIVGDVAFFYDRNGLLMEELPQNLKIILLNNQGGTIFRMIDGPASQPELQKYFETRHHFNARRTAEDSTINYFVLPNLPETSLTSLENVWGSFVNANTVSILEIQTDPIVNEKTYRDLKAFVSKQ
ncbi:hypothetical protein GCM10007390_41580 [Persicitalea jodogahamensis]|uniref:Menaquinone biosynthesis protein MenD middle domain-containing protein n=1 Tax=Persicitalea jodogahamensis TaxID=402147 RepID=A0A8J3GBK0_9BACT|nr:hypothetical protein GCM10007390_41580 [Persicitalea jodogahamensis]